MSTYKPILSDDPKDLEGASEWAKDQIKKIEREEAAADRIMDRIRPLLEKMSQKRKQLANT